MACCRRIENKNRIILSLNNVHYFGHKITRIKRDSFTRFKIDFKVIFFFYISDKFLESLSVIISFCYMMSASEIYPFYLRKKLSKILFNFFKSCFERLKSLFTERMEMKALNTAWKRIGEIFLSNSES